MKKLQLLKAKKQLTKIIDDVLHGEVQAIEKSTGELVYLILWPKKINYCSDIPYSKLSPVMLN